MLVLVVGATGNIGRKLVAALLDRGNRVRALGRTPSKLNPVLHSQLESFHVVESYRDFEALKRACNGVDAIVNAWSGTPELQLEAQLSLLRAAEQCPSVTRFVAASWNYDWRAMRFGEHESYDPYIAFHRQTQLVDFRLKPIYIFTGILAEVLFGMVGHGDFSPRNHGCWDPEARVMEIWGSGEEIWHFTTENDAARFTAEILNREDAVDGGFWCVCSAGMTLIDIAKTYESAKGAEVSILRKGDVEALRQRAFASREKGTPARFFEYIGWFYQLYTVTGQWVPKHWHNVLLSTAPTPLLQFLQDTPEI